MQDPCMMPQGPILMIRPVKFIKNKIESENKTGEATYGGALRAPLAGSPACVFVFVFVLIYVEFEFSPPPTPQLRFQSVKKK